MKLIDQLANDYIQALFPKKLIIEANQQEPTIPEFLCRDLCKESFKNGWRECLAQIHIHPNVPQQLKDHVVQLTVWLNGLEAHPDEEWEHA